MNLRKSNLRSLTILAGVASIATGSVALADEKGEEEHYDIGIWNNGGTLQSGGWDHDSESMALDSLRVYEAHFGEDDEFPFSIDEPGVGGVAEDVNFELGSTLQLNLASGLGYWNGDGFSSSSSSIQIDYGPTSVNSTTGGLLDFLVIEDYDYHPIFTIDSGAPSGSYLLEFTAQMDGMISSDSFWIVFNLGMDDEDFEDTVGWVEANLAPAPGAVALLAIGGLCGARRRRG